MSVHCGSISTNVPSGYSATPPNVLLCDPFECRSNEGVGCLEVNSTNGSLRDLNLISGKPQFSNRISSIVVPPNTFVRVGDRPGAAIPGPLVLNSKTKTFGPGMYPDLRLQFWNDGGNMENQIQSIHVTTGPEVDHKEWLRKCCSGQISPSSDCANYADPKGPDCQNLMRAYCTETPTAFFGSNCKSYLQGLESSLVNDVAAQMCKPPYQNQAQLDWCACYDISTAPTDISQTAQAFWPCLQQKCNDSSKALQRYPKDCPTTLTMCEQREIMTELSKSALGSQTVQNACGNINLGGSPSGSPAPAPTPPASGGTTNNQGIQPSTVYTLVGAFMGILILVIIGFVLMSKKKK